ncbi:hypothetical protein [Mesorhizobium sp. GbtcB19]|uniref:hypothetical protein n=1 Tax=Mesorhizobium sp. GbtcB19 TaxID=2824764 RepID=UPI001C304861|nr:hypothetical protein [Mesorhizobium sp. GbtcB19]
MEWFPDKGPQLANLLRYSRGGMSLEQSILGRGNGGQVPSFFVAAEVRKSRGIWHAVLKATPPECASNHPVTSACKWPDSRRLGVRL